MIQRYEDVETAWVFQTAFVSHPGAIVGLMMLTSLDVKVLRHLDQVDAACSDELACVARTDPPRAAAVCRHLAERDVVDVVDVASASITTIGGGEVRAVSWRITETGRWVLRGLDETRSGVEARRHPSAAGGDVT